MNWIRRSSNISKFISSRLQAFGRIDVLKKSHKVHRTTPVLEFLLLKMQASNLQSENLIKGEIQAQAFPCGF